MSFLSNLYLCFRCSSVYDHISRWRGTEYARAINIDRMFFKKLFDAYSIRSVFDIGANVGDKATVFSEIAERVVCVEADPTTSTWLRWRFAFNSAVVVKNVAVGSEVGEGRLYRKNYSGFNTLSQKWSDASGEQGVSDGGMVDVQVTTLDALISLHGSPDYIKIDVEGYELPAIRGLNQGIRVLSFEANIPAFLPETREIIKAINGREVVVRYNLRIADEVGFHFADFVETETLLSELEKLSPFTCDVFAVSASL